MSLPMLLIERTTLVTTKQMAGLELTDKENRFVNCVNTAKSQQECLDPPRAVILTQHPEIRSALEAGIQVLISEAAQLLQEIKDDEEEPEINVVD